MSTNNQKNRHLSDVVAALNETSKTTQPTMPETDANSGNPPKPSFQVPPQPPARQAERPYSHNSEKITPLIPDESPPPKSSPIPPPKPSKPHRHEHDRPRQPQHPKQQPERPGKRIQITASYWITSLLLLIVLGAVVYSAYWTDTKLNRLEVLYAAMPPYDRDAADPSRVNPPAGIEQLQAHLNELENKLNIVTTTLADNHQSLGEELTKLQASIKEIQRANAKPTAKPEPVVAKPSQTATRRISTNPPESWFVNLGTFYTQDAAKPLLGRAKQLGLAPKITTANLGGKPGYRIQLVGIGDRREAEQLAESLEQRLKINGLWVGRE